MGFALLVDVIQMRASKKQHVPVKTREHYSENEAKNVEETF
jgi:hypothetical protein